MTKQDLNDLRTLFALGRQGYAKDRDSIVQLLTLEDKLFEELNKSKNGMASKDTKKQLKAK